MAVYLEIMQKLRLPWHNLQYEQTGARGLRAILEENMIDIMYELPEYSGYEVLITKEVIENGETPVYIKKSTKKTA